ncbi:hypothetical protein J4477_00210, partial [Candidatus Pacearchaeota archaeon]|nr:hypothetical protein [Candidatus Pacearchaeota archaeon]
MEKDNFDFKKVKQFVGSVLEDYHNHKDIEKLCILRDTENTDGSFTQIGIRPLVDADMLLPDKNGVAFDPRLPAIGMDVANGEREFLIKNILNEFKPEEFVKLDKLEDFPAHIYTFRNPILLVSLKFFVEIHNLMIKRITWKDYKTLLD